MQMVPQMTGAIASIRSYESSERRYAPLRDTFFGLPENAGARRRSASFGAYGMKGVELEEPFEKDRNADIAADEDVAPELLLGPSPDSSPQLPRRKYDSAPPAVDLQYCSPMMQAPLGGISGSPFLTEMTDRSVGLPLQAAPHNSLLSSDLELCCSPDSSPQLPRRVRPHLPTLLTAITLPTQPVKDEGRTCEEAHSAALEASPLALSPTPLQVALPWETRSFGWNPLAEPIPMTSNNLLPDPQPPLWDSEGCMSQTLSFSPSTRSHAVADFQMPPTLGSAYQQWAYPVSDISTSVSSKWSEIARSDFSGDQSPHAVATPPPLIPPPPQYVPTIAPNPATIFLAHALEPSPAPSTKPQRTERSHKASSVASSDVTTMMIRNLPPHMAQSVLLKELNQRGFEHTYNFLYMPQAFNAKERKCAKGFAFVNFFRAETAAALVDEWHGQHFFGMSVSQPALNISPADVQGLEANLKKWANPRLRRIRNPNFRPFVLEEDLKRLQNTTEAAHEEKEASPRPVEQVQQEKVDVAELNKRSRLSDAMRRAEAFIKQAQRSNVRDTTGVLR